MSRELPTWNVPAAPSGWNPEADFAALAWESIPPLPPLTLHDGSGLAQQKTVVRVCANEAALYINFACQDSDIWANYTQRNDPIYDEEVVELFLALGEADPTQYHEIELNPNGVIFAAHVTNPTLNRADLSLNFDWPYAGLRWAAWRHDAAGYWSATIVLPWADIIVPFEGELPKRCRANFYRIERPRGGEPEFSCWSPTLVHPPDFHRPDRFGMLVFET